jgi:hypothetical protein
VLHACSPVMVRDERSARRRRMRDIASRVGTISALERKNMVAKKAGDRNSTAVGRH